MARRNKPEIVVKDDKLDYALWWVTRWVSGSMRDPDWSWPEAETLTVEQAFALVREEIGNDLTAAGPFWRYLEVSKAEAARLLAGGDLMPNRKSTFQSFTTSRALADEFGEFAGGKGKVPVVVRVEVPPELVMFGMEDLQADRRASSTVMSLDLWHHQKEIMVAVDRPLRVIEAYGTALAKTVDPEDLEEDDLEEEAGFRP